MTYFAPAARASAAELERAIEVVASSPVMVEVLAALGGAVVLLNRERQIVGANPGLLKMLGCPIQDGVLGLRLGEALGCRNAARAPSGCGTGKPCADCGAVLAILGAQCDGDIMERECLLTLASGDRALELWARAAPFSLEGHPFVLLSLQDISDRKRREHLERVFLHDLMNTVGALSGYQDLLRQGAGATREILIEMHEVVARLVEEIRTHQDLGAAERGDIRTNVAPVSTATILDDLARLFLRHEVACERSLYCSGARIRIRTDPFLLERVLVNMVKNAFEASLPGAEVSVMCTARPDAVEFAVHNPGYIEPRVSAHVFQRSFSTKPGVGRGLGTYSMKLFGERYLRGRVRFETSPERGTTFTLCIPRDLEDS